VSVGSSTAGAVDAGYPKPAYSWYVVTILLLAYITSFLDRTILTLLVGPIRETLQISDLELSLLHGFAFAVFYVVLGIPIARYADSNNRVRLISLGILFWSVMTAVCGFAKTFWHMFLGRVGVGIGQATLSPAAYSILSDYFPPRKLSRALSVYQTGIYAGMGLAMIIGGFVIANVPALEVPYYGVLEPWQVVFLIVSLPGILIFFFLRTIREPERKGMLSSSNSDQSIPVSEVAAFIGARRKAYGYVVGGVAAKSLAFYGIAAWLPTYFIRTYQWDVATVGLYYGLGSIVFGTLGINLGSMASVWLRSRGYVDANVRICMVALACLVPVGILAPLVSSAMGAMALFYAFIFFAAFPVGCQAAALQEITPNQMRAQVTALYLFISNMCGIGLGPTFIAFFTDIVFENDMAVGYSMSLAVAIACPIGVLFFWRGLKPYREALNSAASGYQEQDA
jgi:MFS family permease